MTTFFKKFQQNTDSLRSRVLVSNFKSLVSGFLKKSRSRSFDQVSVSTTSLVTRSSQKSLGVAPVMISLLIQRDEMIATKCYRKAKNSVKKVSVTL